MKGLFCADVSEHVFIFWILGSCLPQQQPVWTDGLLHDGPRLDVVVAFRDVHQPHVLPVTLLSVFWVDAVLENHFVSLPVHLRCERLAEVLRHLDVWCGVHPPPSRLHSDYAGSAGVQESRLIVGSPVMGENDGAVHDLSLVGDGPGVRPRPEPGIPIAVFLQDSQGHPVPSAGTNVFLITAQERLVAILRARQDVNC